MLCVDFAKLNTRLSPLSMSFIDGRESIIGNAVRRLNSGTAAAAEYRRSRTYAMAISRRVMNRGGNMDMSNPPFLKIASRGSAWTPGGSPEVVSVTSHSLIDKPN
jgi:hypothetical protein